MFDFGAFPKTWSCSQENGLEPDSPRSSIATEVVRRPPLAMVKDHRPRATSRRSLLARPTSRQHVDVRSATAFRVGFARRISRSSAPHSGEHSCLPQNLFRLGNASEKTSKPNMPSDTSISRSPSFVDDSSVLQGLAADGGESAEERRGVCRKSFLGLRYFDSHASG